MKIKDLTFEPHSADPSGTRAEVNFDNGYGASVVTGKLFYTNTASPYELAVLKGDSICYDTPITNDVIGYLTENAVDQLLAEIEAL